MGLLRRLGNAAREQGVRGIVAKAAARPADFWFDWRWGVETLAVETLDGPAIAEGDRRLGGFYEGSRTLAVGALLTDLRRTPSGQGALVDVGCGKGKVLMLAALAGFSTVRGVEFSRDLCDAARENWRRFAVRSRSAATCEVIEADAAAMAYHGDESLFFFFNPFVDSVLRGALARIRESLAERPRDARLVFACMNEPFRRVLAEELDLALEREPTRWGVRFSVYRPRPS